MKPSFTPNRTFMMNKEQERLWANSIGGLILNFGFLEFASYRWIQHFARDPLVGHDLAMDMTLSKRLQTIRDLIGRSDLPMDVRKRAIELWDEVEKLSEVRNTIAHNPIVFGEGLDGQPAMGIPNVKKMKGQGPFQVTLVPVLKIREAALHLVAISSELEKLIASEA
jgi:hypothetical protein